MFWLTDRPSAYLQFFHLPTVPGLDIRRCTIARAYNMSHTPAFAPAFPSGLRLCAFYCPHLNFLPTAVPPPPFSHAAIYTSYLLPAVYFPFSYAHTHNILPTFTTISQILTGSSLYSSPGSDSDSGSRSPLPHHHYCTTIPSICCYSLYHPSAFIHSIHGYRIYTIPTVQFYLRSLVLHSAGQFTHLRHLPPRRAHHPLPLCRRLPHLSAAVCARCALFPQRARHHHAPFTCRAVTPRFATWLFVDDTYYRDRPLLVHTVACVIVVAPDFTRSRNLLPCAWTTVPRAVIPTIRSTYLLV